MASRPLRPSGKKSGIASKRKPVRRRGDALPIGQRSRPRVGRTATPLSKPTNVARRKKGSQSKSFGPNTPLGVASKSTGIPVAQLRALKRGAKAASTPKTQTAARRAMPRVGPRKEMPTPTPKTQTEARRGINRFNRGTSARARSYLRSMFGNRPK